MSSPRHGVRSSRTTITAMVMLLPMLAAGPAAMACPPVTIGGGKASTPADLAEALEVLTERSQVADATR